MGHPILPPESVIIFLTFPIEIAINWRYTTYSTATNCSLRAMTQKVWTYIPYFQRHPRLSHSFAWLRLRRVASHAVSKLLFSPSRALQTWGRITTALGGLAPPQKHDRSRQTRNSGKSICHHKCNRNNLYTIDKRTFSICSHWMSLGINIPNWNHFLMKPQSIKSWPSGALKNNHHE